MSKAVKLTLAAWVIGACVPALAQHGAEKPANKPAQPASHGAAAKPATETKPAAENKPAAKAAKAKVESDEVTADEALKLLAEGNERWVKGAASDPATEPSRRAELAESGQKPFVTILSCADSRVPVERVFDRGVGELFVIRVAGNIAGDSETGTIEYGVGHLKTPLLVVKGHTKCGAVAAAASGAELHGKIGGLVASINPSVERARRNNPGADEKSLAAAAVKENVWQTIFDLLKHSDELREAVAQKKLKVVGAVCDISTGKVDLMGEHPWQTELMAALNATSGAGEPHEATAAASEDEHH